MSCAYGAKPTQWETLFSNHWPVASIGSALSIHVGNCSTRLPPPVAGYYDLEKIYFSSLNFHESPFFLSQLQNRVITFLNFSNHAFYLPRAGLKAVLLQ